MMSFGVALDVALGLGLVFIVLATIASAIQELIAALLSRRGKVLLQMIRQMLEHQAPETARTAGAAALPPTADGPAAGTGGVANVAYANVDPAPGPTSADARTATAAAVRADVGGTGVSAPAGALVLVAPKLVCPVASGQKLADLVISHPLINGLATANRSGGPRIPSYLPARNFALALIETLRRGQDEAVAVGAQVERAVGALPDGQVKRTLTALIVDAKGDLDAFQASVQTWFDDAMDRAAGVYKRWSQYTLLVIGIVLAVALNVDVLRLSATLWADPQARAALAEMARTCVADPNQAMCKGLIPATVPQKAASAAPAGSGRVQLAANGSLPIPADPAARPAADASALEQQIATTTKMFSSLPIPIGWDKTTWSDWNLFAGPRTVRQKLGFVLSCLLGWLLTGAAVSLGAPFWFDALQNIANLRGAGPVPAKAPPAN